MIDLTELRRLEAAADPSFIISLPDLGEEDSATGRYINTAMELLPELMDDYERLQWAWSMTTETAKRRLDALRDCREELRLAMAIINKRADACEKGHCHGRHTD